MSCFSGGCSIVQWPSHAAPHPTSPVLPETDNQKPRKKSSRQPKHPETITPPSIIMKRINHASAFAPGSAPVPPHPRTINHTDRGDRGSSHPVQPTGDHSHRTVQALSVPPSGSHTPRSDFPLKNHPGLLRPPTLSSCNPPPRPGSERVACIDRKQPLPYTHTLYFLYTRPSQRADHRPATRMDNDLSGAGQEPARKRLRASHAVRSPSPPVCLCLSVSDLPCSATRAGPRK
jgi:hypothetical protein